MFYLKPVLSHQMPTVYTNVCTMVKHFQWYEYLCSVLHLCFESIVELVLLQLFNVFNAVRFQHSHWVFCGLLMGPYLGAGSAFVFICLFGCSSVFALFCSDVSIEAIKESDRKHFCCLSAVFASLEGPASVMQCSHYSVSACRARKEPTDIFFAFFYYIGGQ